MLDASAFETTLQAAREGDLQAFNRLVLDHQATLYNLAYRVLGDERAAAEAAQAALAGAWRGLASYRGEPFRLWVLRWLVRACRPRLGRQAAPVVSGLAGRLAGLPPAECLALALVDLGGLDYAQAAAVLDVSPRRLRGDLARARRRLGQADMAF